MSTTGNNAQGLPADFQLAQQLTWQFVDEVLDEEGLQQLQLLLTHSEAGRRGYVEAMQLHADLMGHFGQLPDTSHLLEQALATAAAAASPEKVKIQSLPATLAVLRSPTGV